LRDHPRFGEDFLPHVPPDVTSDAERDRWIFAHASTWPDLARGQPAFDRGTWHYVNLPLRLRQGRLHTCAQARDAFPESVREVAAHSAARQAAGEEPIPSGDSIREALANARRKLGDEGAPAPERALALSWVLHLVADAHQPLHGVALFTEQRFVTGDRGGNDILIEGRGSLHRVWDGLLGEETSSGALEQKLQELRTDRHLSKLGAAAARNLDLDRWIDEGCELARSAVYVPAILSSVQELERERGEGKPQVRLRQSYVDAAARTARVRAVQAGARLARLLETVLRKQSVREERARERPRVREPEGAAPPG
jgi:hypothetical protein